MKKFNRSRYTAVLFIFATLASCVLTNKKELTKPKQGLVEVNIEGDLNTNFHAEGDCGAVSAKYYPFDLDYTDYHGLVIQGFADNKIFSIMLYFKGEFPSNPIFKLDMNEAEQNSFGIGSFIPDVNNALANNYMTDDRSTGTCTVTEYDQVNQTISGTFNFTTQGFNNGAELAGVHASFTGSFSNVPIVDLTDPSDPKGPCFGSTGNGLGEGSGSGNNNGNPQQPPTNNTSSIIYKNNSFTPIEITINNETKTINTGSSVTFTGKTGSSATGTATTSGKTSSGTQVGLLLTWNLNNSFPSSGTASNDLNVSGTFFFLKVINRSYLPMNKLYVNYGLIDQTIDNISISNDGLTYSLGYYKAYSNTTVRAENGNNYWLWQSLGLTNTPNQSITLTGN